MQTLTNKLYTYPTLYKMSNGGKVTEWDIHVDDNGPYPVIVVIWGYKNGAKQEKVTEICDGKNIGRSNETTPLEQAVNEAQSKWNKQKDKGYSQDIPTVKSVFLPMLAQRYDKHGNKIKFPAYIQPKLDGIRCLGTLSGLMSRLGKPINSVPHIEAAIQKLHDEYYDLTDVVFDGELYVHGHNFQDIIKKVKRDELHPDHEKIEYHIYDIADDSKPFEKRNAKLLNYLLDGPDKDGVCTSNFGPLHYVTTWEVEDDSKVTELFNKFVQQGYEGAIIRNKAGLYEFDKRSYNLQKVKEFMDEEFEIVGGELDKNNECVFVCKTKAGTEFRCKPEGTHAERRKYYDDLGSLIGKMLTIRFFEWTTSTDKVPRFPVGVCIRDYE